MPLSCDSGSRTSQRSRPGSHGFGISRFLEREIAAPLGAVFYCVKFELRSAHEEQRVRKLRGGALFAICRWCLLMVVPVSAFGSATVTGRVSNPGTGVPSGSNFVQFELQGCGNNPARATQAGEAATLTALARFLVDASGNIKASDGVSGAVIVRNDQISCGGVTTSTFYLATVFSNNSPVAGSVQKYRITSSSFDLNSALPISINPVVPAPSGDTTYARLDGANTPFVGKINFYTGGAPQPDAAFLWSTSFFTKYTSLSDQLNIQIPSTILLQLDAFSGGFNSGTHKTQWQPLRVEFIGRTVGERKGMEVNVKTLGKGDSIGGMFSAYDWGGYLTGGDEGSEGIRAAAVQTDGAASGNVPVGAVTGIDNPAGTVTVAWSNGTGAYVGEQRPIIITSRAIYNSGTVASTDTTGGCRVVGAGTGWSALGVTGLPIGGKFLEITGNTNGIFKHVVPLSFLTDATHIQLSYLIAEIGSSCYGSLMTSSGAYNIYAGEIVTGMSNPDAAGNPQTFTFLNNNISAFQVGDAVEQPIGYNFHAAAVQVVIGRKIGDPSSSAAIKVDNIDTPQIGDAMFVNGAFVRGIRFGTGAVSGHLFHIDFTVGGSVIHMNNAGSTQDFITALDGGLALRHLFQWSKTNNYVAVNNTFNAGLNGISTCSTPQSNIIFYLGCPGGANTQLVIESSSAHNSGIPIFDVSTQGTRIMRLFPNGMTAQFWNAVKVQGYSDAGSIQKWSIDSASGNISTAGTMTSTVATGTPAIAVSSTTPPVNLYAKPLGYDHNGTQKLGSVHTVDDFCTLGSTCAVTFAGGAAYSNSGSYHCTANDTNAAAAVMVNQIDGSHITFTGTGTDLLVYHCAGQ